MLLGAAWLLDAALQFQPYMSSRGFVTQVIEPAAAGNPAIIARPLLWSARIRAHHPAADPFHSHAGLPAGVLFGAAEGFGFLASGQATDPNSGPLLVLLAACFAAALHPPGAEPAAAGGSGEVPA